MPGTAVEIHGREAGIELATRRIFKRGRPFSFTFVAAPSTAASNQTCVSIQIIDFYGNSVPGVFMTEVWLSDAATGAGLTATTASGNVQNGGNAGGTIVTAAGADIGTKTAKKALDVQTDVNGKYTLQITDSAKTLFYVCAVCPDDDTTVVSAQLTAAAYG